ELCREEVMNQRRGRRSGSDGKMRGGVSRRTFVRGVVAASVAAGLPVSSALGFARNTESAFLGRSRAVLLTAILNRVVPADDGMPAAGDLGVGAFVAEAGAANARLRRQVDRLPGAWARQNGAAGSDGAVGAALRRPERDRRRDSDLFIQAVYAGYYTHPRVVQALGCRPT